MALLHTFVAYLVSDKGSERREVYAVSQADAMNKIFMTTSEDTILVSINIKY